MKGAVIVVVVCTYVLCVAVLGQGISLASFTPSARNSVCGRATQRPGEELNGTHRLPLHLPLNKFSVPTGP